MKKISTILFVLIAICMSSNARISFSENTKVEQFYQGSSIHSRLVEIVKLQNEYTRSNNVESNGITVKPIIIGSESEKLITFEFDIDDNVYNYSNHELKSRTKAMKKVSKGYLKQQSTSDEMTRLAVEGNYTLRYIYYDKHGKVLYDYTIKADELK